MSSPLRCSKPLCGSRAVARLTYDHAGSAAWLDPVAVGEGGLGLCADHAARLAVPRGWELVDRRSAAATAAAELEAAPLGRPVPSARPALVRHHRLAS